MSGDRVQLIGPQMAAVVHGLGEVQRLVSGSAVVVGGLAVLCRLTRPYRATTDLDVVDRLSGASSHLEVLRSAAESDHVDDTAVLLPTPFGAVRVDVLEVRSSELTDPSDDPGDRLHAFSHAWAADTATAISVEVLSARGGEVISSATAQMAEPGPLVAMKLQALEDRPREKQGTDLLDIHRLVLDPLVRDVALDQIESVDVFVAADVTLHVQRWLRRHRAVAIQRMHAVGGTDLALEDVDLVAELIEAACGR